MKEKYRAFQVLTAGGRTSFEVGGDCHGLRSHCLSSTMTGQCLCTWAPGTKDIEDASSTNDYWLHDRGHDRDIFHSVQWRCACDSLFSSVEIYFKIIHESKGKWKTFHGNSVVHLCHPLSSRPIYFHLTLVFVQWFLRGTFSRCLVCMETMVRTF